MPKLKKSIPTLSIPTAEEAALDPFLTSRNVHGEKPWANAPEQEVELDRILLPDFRFRLYYDPTEIEKLRSTIRSVGVREPILLRPHPEKEGHYELVAGSSRRYAAELEGMPKILAKVDEVDDLTAAKISFIENYARSNPNPYEFARYLCFLAEMSLGKTREELTSQLQSMYNQAKSGNEEEIANNLEWQQIASIFDSVGINWRSFVSNQMPLLKGLKPDIEMLLEQGKLDYTKALRLNRVQDEALRRSLTQKTIEEDLSVRELEALISASKPARKVGREQQLKQRFKTVLNSLKNRDEEELQQLEKLLQNIESLLGVKDDGRKSH